MRHPFFLFLTIFLLAFGLTMSAHAQSSRVYFAGYMGLNTNTDQEFSESTTPASGDMQFKNALSFAGALGLRLNNNWRLEGELSYRKSGMDRIDVSGAGSTKLDGNLKTWLLMANAYYDFDLSWRKLTPFVTAGLGFASHEGQIANGAGTSINASDDALALAWQVGGGLKYRVNDDMALTGGYRYLGTTDLELDAYNIDYSSHEIRFGLEYDLPVDMFLR